MTDKKASAPAPVGDTKTGNLHDNLNALGSAGTEYQYASADAKLLEAFPNPMLVKLDGSDQAIIEVASPEFTSLCPKTGQPDFATILINYVPNTLCLESKSLKLYLGSFRMARMFHEACVQKVCDDLVALLDPYMMVVQGQFSSRGGIKFWPTAKHFKKMPMQGATFEFINLDQAKERGILQ